MPTFSAVDYYEEARPGDFVELLWRDGAECVKVDGCVYTGGAEKPVQVYSTQGKRYALGEGDRVRLIERQRGF